MAISGDLFLRGAYYLQAIVAALLAVVAARNFRTAVSEWHIPHYHFEAHHSCHALAYLIGFLMVWYFVLTASLVLHRATIKQRWALSLLGLPSLLLLFFGMAIIVTLIFMYAEHDEHWFAGTLALGSAGFYGMLSFFSLAILYNPISQRDPTTKRWTYQLLVFLAVVTGLHFFNEFYSLFFISAASLAIYVFGMNLMMEVPPPKDHLY